MARKTRVVEPVEEIEDDELETVEDDDDLEELEDEAPAPKAKAKKGAAKAAKAAPAKSDAPVYGVTWLAEHINETLDKNVSPTSLRVVLRKMAADGELDRTVGEDRARYSFSGPGDRTVKAVVRKVRDGALERNRTDNLEKARAAKASKKAAAAVAEPDEDEAPATKPTRKRVAAAEAPAPAKKATRKRAG